MEKSWIKITAGVGFLILAVSFSALAENDMGQFTVAPNDQGGTTFTANGNVVLTQPLNLSANDQIVALGNNSIWFNSPGFSTPIPNTANPGPAIFAYNTTPPQLVEITGSIPMLAPMTGQVGEPVMGTIIPSSQLSAAITQPTVPANAAIAPLVSNIPVQVMQANIPMVVQPNADIGAVMNIRGAQNATAALKDIDGAIKFS